MKCKFDALEGRKGEDEARYKFEFQSMTVSMRAGSQTSFKRLESHGQKVGVASFLSQ